MAMGAAGVAAAAAAASAPAVSPPLADSSASAALGPSTGSSARWGWREGLGFGALGIGLLALLWAYQSEQRWQRLHEELVRRQQEVQQQSVESRTLARQAEAVSRDMAAKMALLEARVSESSLQRTQLEELMQSLSRSRDENVLADIEAALRVAQQQAALTGSVEPLATVLKQTEERLARVQQPRLDRVRRAALQDLEKVRAAGFVDINSLTIRLDEVTRQVDELPLLAGFAAATAPAPTAASVASAKPGAGPSTAAGASVAAASASAGALAGAKAAPSGRATAASAARASAPAPVDTESWTAGQWAEGAQRLLAHVWQQARDLVRVTRIDQPDAALLAPEQAVFLRENLRLRLLNARLSLLSRQFDAAQDDLRQAQLLLVRYFDGGSRRVGMATETLRQVAAQARSVTVPRPDATLSAIAAAAPGR
jgi:uroporphyrin-III C-methyltransferase